MQVVNADAFTWLDQNREQFDFIVADFPDPSNFSLGKLYTTAFSRGCVRRLADSGMIVIQCTSPYVARRSFWCVDATLHAAGFVTEPYHVYVPSFGEWGYILASLRPVPRDARLPQGLRFLEPASLPGLFDFPPDMSRVDTEVNRLNNQALVRYFEAGMGPLRPLSRTSRRSFLAAGMSVAAAGMVGGCGARQARRRFPGEIVGASSSLGHRLREGGWPAPARVERATAAVIGGGIAGLSAAHRLARRGCGGFRPAGARVGAGRQFRARRQRRLGLSVGRALRAAAECGTEEVIALFEEFGVITRRDSAGLPIYEERYLCADPAERLLTCGRWQEGLVPQIGVTARDREQYEQFFAAMETMRQARGSDGRRAFAIPVDLSSRDPQWLALDELTMATWMDRQGWDSEPLRWYVNYCCRDDYGAGIDVVSAWAGVHYFASRNVQAANAPREAVLTWPEGNGWLVRRLAEAARGRVRSRCVVWNVESSDDGATMDYFDANRQESVRLMVGGVVCAAPRFIAQRIVRGLPPSVGLEYSPWMVANVTLDAMPRGIGVPLSWDNVIQSGESLGYVVATHQHLHPVPQRTVLTFYWPLDLAPPAEARRSALSQPHEFWAERVAAELERAHPGFASQIARIDVCLWGHGMIRPLPGLIWALFGRACRRRTAGCFSRTPT